MIMGVTIEEVLDLLIERDARQREAEERRAAEADRRAAEAEERRAAEADRRAAEADRRAAERVAELERVIAKNFAEVDRRAEERRTELERLEAERQAELERLETERRAEIERLEAERRAEIERLETERRAETERLEAERRAETEIILRKSKAELDQQVKELNQQMGRLSGRLGQFVEAMIMPSLVSLFRSRGIEVHEVHPNVTATRPQGSIEIDLLVVNDGDAIAVECKSRLTVEDVNEHLLRMDKIKTLLPTYRDKRLLGAVATMVLNDHVGRYAYGKGLYVLAQSGETVTIKNDMNFQPAYW